MNIEEQEKLKKIFSKNLNRWMEIKGKRQIDIMNEFNLNSSTVSNWCNGKMYPRMDAIQALADYLKIDKSDLIEEKETEKENRRLRPEVIGLCNGIMGELGISIKLGIDGETEETLDYLKQLEGDRFMFMAGYAAGLSKASDIVKDTITNISTAGLAKEVVEKIRKSKND